MFFKKKSLPDTFEQDFSSALASFQSGEMDKAKLICSQILEENPDHGNTLNLLGIICCKEGALEEAIEFIQQAINNHSDKAPSFSLNLALVYSMKGDIQTAASIYQKAGKTFLKKGEKNEALLSFEKGAFLLRDRGYLQEAKEFYFKMLEIDPSIISAHNDLGLIFMKEKNLKGAASCFNEVLELDPTYFSAYNNLGLVFCLQKKFKEAAVLFEKAVELEPSFLEAHINLSTIYRQEKDFEKAESHLNHAKEIAPDHPGIFTNLGILLLLQNKKEEAIAHFRKALELDPSSAEAQQNLSRALENPEEMEEQATSLPNNG